MNNGRVGRNEQREVERGEWGRRGIVKGKLRKSLLELGPAYCTSIVYVLQMVLSATVRTAPEEFQKLGCC